MLTRWCSLTLCLGLWGFTLSGLLAGETGPWDLEKLTRTPAVSPAPSYQAHGVEAITYEGPEWRGRPTKIFAFFGLPEGASPEARVPGIILVHGGGGTAFSDWVRQWNGRGYAAIAMDHDGGLPVGETGRWLRNPEGGPLFENGGAIDAPPGDQWMYHAVASAILANSLLRARPEIDHDSIGITGISWGGVITATVAGIDPRLKFAAPVYGCGHISNSSADGSQFVGKNLSPEKLAKWRTLWDPVSYLAGATLPMLWVTGSNDFAFTLRSLEKSVREAKGPQNLSIHLRMEHSQGAGQMPTEIPAFADQIVKMGTPLPRITASGIENGQAWVEFDSPTPIATAILNTTRHQGPLQNRVWNSLPVPNSTGRKNGRLSLELPRGTRAWFFNLTDDRGLTVSSLPVIDATVSP